MRLTIIAAIGFVLVMGANVWAGVWCDNLFPPIVTQENQAVFCDDFDRYCPGPDNNPCPQDQTYNNYAWNAWPRTSWSYHNIQNEECGNEIILSNVQAQLTSIYHGGVMMDGGDEAGVLGQSTRELEAGIEAKWPGHGYDRVSGTDAAPLVLNFDMASNIHSAASLDLSDGYVELALEEQTLTKQEFLALGYDPEVTPTDYIKVGGLDEKLEGCLSCWGMCKNLGATDSRAPHHMWPTICQSYDARTASSLCPNPAGGDPIPCGPPYCPETPVTKLHKTIAIGALAMLDPNPCHCENPVKPDMSACGPNNACGSNGFCANVGGSARPCTTSADCPKEAQEYTNHTATNKHVAFFDGWKWRSLSSAIFDDGQGHGIPGVIGSGDFLLGDKIDHVVLTIKTSTIKIQHWNTQNKGQWISNSLDPCDPDGGDAYYEPGLYSEADNIPRKFLGAFNVIRMGNASSCRLCSSDLVNAEGDYANCGPGQWNGTDYECTEFNQNWGSGATWCHRQSGISGCYGTNIDDGSNFVTIDSLAVTGGTPIPSIGACCEPDTTCVLATSVDCGLLGGYWAGGGSTCANRTCCPIPFADADHDTDVDQNDFGLFQVCYTGTTSGVPTGCACFDRNTDNKVDNTDFTAFDNCFTGANVKWTQVLTPSCTP